MVQSPRVWYQLWCTLCQSFGLQKLVTDGCVHVKYMNNKKSTNQQPNVNLNDLAKHLTPLPIHDCVYTDCPHATAILIVVTYVDDNLVFTNCATLRQTFAAHFNKRGSLQQVRSLQRRRTCLLVSRHAIRSRSNHGRRKSLTEALHQHAPCALAHVRLRPYQNFLLRQAR